MGLAKKKKLSSRTLSYIDASLSLFPGFDTVGPDNVIAIMRSLVVRAHTKDPKLSPLNMTAIKRECCTPALMFLHLSEVIRCSVVGPYANNPLGYLSYFNAFYVLKDISGGVRMWVHDARLAMVSSELRKGMLTYVNKLIRTIENQTSNREIYILKHLYNTRSALERRVPFRKLMCSIISEKSPIIPTEADMFDYIPGISTYKYE